MTNVRRHPKHVAGVDVGRKDATVVVVLQRDPETGRLRIVDHREIPKEAKVWTRTKN